MNVQKNDTSKILALATCSVQPLTSIPNLAASACGLSYMDKTHIRPRWASSEVSVFRGGLRDQPRHFTHSHTDAVGVFGYRLCGDSLRITECMEFAGITRAGQGLLNALYIEHAVLVY